MPKAMDRGAGRLLARMPRPTVYSALEIVLLTLLAVQCARLVWTLVTPVGPLGDWRPASALRPLPAAGAAADFDPFFRLGGEAGPAVVTALDLKLHGVREDRATGRGSAIIGLPGGEQASFAVGEEILPGVVLSAVAFDSVTITRGGTEEQIFLDQSPPAAEIAAAVPAAPQAAPSIVESAPPIDFEPRMAGGKLAGIAVRPRGDGAAFRAAGFAPGDVIVAVNGAPVRSADQLRALDGAAEAALTVDRGGRQVTMRVRLPQ
jgi:general secretion pathway protein C